MFSKVLVPLDGSPLAEQALAKAALIAREAGAAMDLVMVQRPSPFGPPSEAHWNQEHRYLEGIANEIAAGASITVTHSLRTGEPVEEICRRAADVGADLIALSSHGRTGLSRAWLGSVADGLMRHATVPVLVLRSVAPTHRPLDGPHAFKHVLVPLDDSALAAEVIPWALTLAKCSGARVSLLRVVQPIPVVPTSEGVPFPYMPAYVDEAATTHTRDEAAARLHEMAKRLSDESGLSVCGYVEVDPAVSATIAAFALANQADVIAMSTHGGGLSRLLLGSVADALLRHSDRPLLLFHPGARTVSGNESVLERPRPAAAPL